ncbi:MAG: hypothetical protein KDA42_07535 [Planctomycetales bacterium]|nr:hypothetical protein [Planctomycetales bacterium]
MNSSLQKLVVCIAVLASLSGCAQFQEHQSRRWTKKLAENAFKEDPCAQKGGPTARDFERGWRQAYYDVARGSDGQPPVLPPQSYWAIKYQNADGAQRIAAWYEGYLLGASAAHRDGVGLYNVIPTSPLADCCGNGCSNCSSCATFSQPVLPAQAMPVEETTPTIAEPVAPIIDYASPPLSDARATIQSLPPVEPEPIQVAETRPIRPTSALGPRYDSQLQQVGFEQPIRP